MKYGLVDIKVDVDSAGKTISFAQDVNCPFDLKRVFYIYGIKDDNKRGCHANRKSEFLMVALNGSCKVKVDTGLESKIFDLNNPDTALYLNKMLWKEMYDFSSDCVLAVFSNEKYDANEYIREYAEFLKEINV